MRLDKLFTNFSGFAKPCTVNWAGAVASNPYQPIKTCCFCLNECLKKKIKEQSCVYREMKDREYISWSSYCFINIVAIKFLHRQDSALSFRQLSFLI